MSYGDRDNWQALTGRRIDKIEVEPGEEYIRFQTDAGPLAWITDGDCCSETWFADIVGVKALLGATVTKVENVEIPEVEDGRTRQEVDSFYGVSITTDRGVAKIIYRNSSNGYYGGDARPDAQHVPSKLVEITDDWQAAPEASP
jgi:hypothetical protein